MSDNRQLLGHPIIPSSRMTLVEQVYDILCTEIHSGRWKVGQKLPSISAMAEESGVSSMPIHQAVEQLREEGYLRTEKGSGTYLAAMLPKGAQPQGSVGILMAHQDERQMGPTHRELDHWRLHAIIQEAVRRNYTEEVKYLDRGHADPEIDRVGGLFGDNVKGIISLHDFPREDYPILPPDRIPFVYLGYTGFRGRPRVTLDLEEGFYRLTREVIQHGHRSVVCFGAEPTARERDSMLIFAGYERAMDEAGLAVDREVYEASRRIERGEWNGFRRFLERYAGARAEGERVGTATTLVCAKSHRAMDLVVVADMLGIRIPVDLSVVGFATPMRASRPEQRFTGIDYNLESTVEECFGLLFRQMETRRNDVSVLQVKPLIREGDSLAPPRSEAGDGATTEHEETVSVRGA
jgi:GntR family transcriptional regulator of arabinose operon